MTVEYEAGLKLARKLVTVENERDNLRKALIAARHQLIWASGLVANTEHRANIDRAISLADSALNDAPRAW